MFRPPFGSTPASGGGGLRLRPRERHQPVREHQSGRAEVSEAADRRRGKQVAKVAIARKILTLCFYGLRDGEIRCLAPRAGRARIGTPAVTPVIRPAQATAPVPGGEHGRSSELASSQWPLPADQATDGRRLAGAEALIEPFDHALNDAQIVQDLPGWPASADDTQPVDD